MNDRELLELAAKAAELPECGWMGPSFMYVKNNTFTDWSPLTDDGDALRLAVNLDMIVKVDRVDGYTKVIFGYSVGMICNETHGSDPYAATRRAIVRAAAEVGKGIKQPAPIDLLEDNYYKSQAEAFEKGMK